LKNGQKHKKNIRTDVWLATYMNESQIGNIISIEQDDILLSFDLEIGTFIYSRPI
jgi:hypothetical protein